MFVNAASQIPVIFVVQVIIISIMMRVWYLCCLLLLPAFFTVHGQALLVISEVTGKPVENVVLYNCTGSISVITSPQGRAVIDIFRETDTIWVQHTSYEPVKYSMSELASMNYTIYLVRRTRMLDEFVLSVHRWEQDRREIPNRIVSVSSSQVALSNPQTTADLIGITGDVFVQKSQLGGGSPMIRGFSANSLLLVIDGVRMNNAIYRSGNLHNIISLDPNMIESSEVIFGPGSVIYGSDALGGVMDFHTRRVSLSTGPQPITKVTGMMRYSTANHEKTGHLSFNKGYGKWGFLGGVSYHLFDDLRMGNKGREEYQREEYVAFISGTDSIVRNKNKNIQRYTGYSQFNLTQKVRFRPNDHWNILYGFHYSLLSDVPRYDRLIQYRQGRLRFSEWYYGPQKWVMNNLKVEYGHTNRFFDHAVLILAHQKYEESRYDRKYRDLNLNQQEESVNALSLGIDLDKKSSRGSSFFYGLEVIYNSVTSRAFSRDIFSGNIVKAPTRYPDGSNHYYALAGYFSYKKNLNEKTTFLAGTRANRAGLNSLIDDTSMYQLPFRSIDLANGAINGSVGMVYRPGQTWQLNLNLSSGFRAPNLDDVGKVFESGDGVVVVPNPGLGPEYAYNIDLGMQKDFGERSRLEITGFFSMVDQIMVRRDFLFNGLDSMLYQGEWSKVNALVNEDRGYISGLSFSARAGLTSAISVRSGLSYTYGKTSEGIPLRHVAPLFGTTHLMYEKEGLKADLYVDINGPRPHRLMAPSELGKPGIYALDNTGRLYSPGWYTLNLKLVYRFGETWEANAGLENILNHRYRPYSSGIVAPGRNLILSLRFSF